jgi:phosphotriesterase-related protein
MLHHYGGKGYDHILTNIVPQLKQAGLDDKTIQTLMVDNPCKLLVAFE